MQRRLPRRALLLCQVLLFGSCVRAGYDAVDPDAKSKTIDAGATDLSSAETTGHGDSSGDLGTEASTSSPDGPLPPCPAVCNGGCPGGVCVIDEALAPVICPPDMACRVNCTTKGACRGNVTCGSGDCDVVCGSLAEAGQCDDIDCSKASACDIRCISGTCSGAITCGPATSCVIECQGDGTCGGAISCAAQDCDIRCLGSGACKDTITCGSGRCTVACGDGSANGQCAGDIDCSTACACDISCLGLGSCDGTEFCPANCAGGTGCVSSLTGCDNC